MVLFEAFDLEPLSERQKGYSEQYCDMIEDYLNRIVELLSEQSCELVAINYKLNRLLNYGVGP